MHNLPRAIVVAPPSKKWQGKRWWPSLMRLTATLLLIVFVTLSLHGHWPRALTLLLLSFTGWRLNELWRRRGDRLAILKEIETMPQREFVVYIGELFRAQGYAVLSSDFANSVQADLLLSRGQGAMACWVLHGRRSDGVKMVARAAATVRVYDGWRPMLLSSRRLTLLEWYRLRRTQCVVIHRERLAQLMMQQRRGHRVITLPREEKPKLRRRK
jgi:hypothetical protein